MGLLSVGTPLVWPDSAPHRDYVREHGILQFIAHYNNLKDRVCDEFLWGDEVEYIICDISQPGHVALSLNAAAIMDTIKQKQQNGEVSNSVTLLPEYGRFMIEATPGRPYGGFSCDLSDVEHNMRLRRQIIQAHCAPGERVMTLSTFPMLGVGTDYTTAPARPKHGPIANSAYISDEVINPHPRFGALTRNIRLRRGSNVDIRVPLFRDERTPSDAPEQIHMDAMAFGMGACCLQTTYQCRSVTEARDLYDQLAVLSPIMLALTASTPFHRGQIADTDVRWTVISQSVDDRDRKERGLEPIDPATDGRKQRIPKSRYDSISCYLSQGRKYRAENNDLEPVKDEAFFALLVEHGIDERLATHIAHLFVRDPLVIFNELIELDDARSTNHFENIQSTNWQTVRFKPPPEDSDIGWRVEFRPMEIQFTEFENAAFIVFMALVSRAILFFDLNFYIPLSKVDANMETAHRRDALNNDKFFWRHSTKACPNMSDSDGFGEYSVAEIICGRSDSPGLTNIVRAYLSVIECDEQSREQVESYLELIERRARGELWTTAKWLRNFVAKHPKYQHDSNLSSEICRDMVDVMDDIANGRVKAPKLVGDYVAPTIDSVLGENQNRSPMCRKLRGQSFSFDTENQQSICAILKQLLSDREVQG